MPTLLIRDIDTPLGTATAGVVAPGATAHEPGGVCLIELGSPDRRTRERAELETHFSTVFVADNLAGHAAGSALLDSLQSQLAEYFAGDRTEFDLPLVTPGTRFQHEVWDAMRTIPCGQTTTYGTLAKSTGRPPTASRAVGAASGRNRVSILIPCHRVVDAAYDREQGGATGLRGYGGGLQNKQRLLEHEQALIGRGRLFAHPLGA